MDGSNGSTVANRPPWSIESLVFGALLIALAGAALWLWVMPHSGRPVSEILVGSGFFVVGAALLLRLYRESAKRKAAEIEHTRVGKRLHALLDQLPAVMWTTDSRLRLSSIGGAAAAHFLEGRTHVIGQHIADLFPSTNGPSGVIDGHHKALRGESSHNEAHQGQRIFDFHIEPMCDASNHIVGCLSIGLDITRRKQAERSSRDTEKRFQDLVHNSRGFICTHDLDGVITSVNPAAAAGLGRSQDHCIGRSLRDFLVPSERKHFSKYLERIKEHGIDEGMMRILLANGRERSWAYHNSIAQDADGNSYVVAHAQDVTDRIKTEEALRQSEQRFRDFAQTAADFFWEQDKDLRFVYLSDRCHTVLGLSAAQMVGQTWHELLSEHGEFDHKWERDLHGMKQHVAFEDVEIKWQRPDSEFRIIRLSGRPVFGDNDQFVGYRGVSRDVTHSYRMTEQITYQATHDDLTDLVNRREFERRVRQAVANAQDRGTRHALCYMDLDQFKLVNDTAGHGAGDELLRSLVDFLKHLIRRGDTLSRLGGDEFGLLLENCSLKNAIDIAQSIIDCVAKFRFGWKEQNFTIGISIGVVPIDSDTESAEQVLSQGDVACYTAKDMGRNRFHVYDAQDSEPARFHQELFQAAELQEALNDQRLEVHAQPIYAVGEGVSTLRYYEILLRLIDRDGALVPPNKFIPAAERYGMMPALDRWVVRHLCETFRDTLTLPPEVGLSINLSSHSLLDDTLIDDVVSAITQSKLVPGLICFEITESAATLNLSATLNVIEKLKAAGCEVALDDFGSGLSSFAYLRDLPVDYLKIDGSFIRDMAGNSIDRSMVSMINKVGHMVGTQTVAKSVETKEGVTELTNLGIDFVQGFYLGRPAPVHEVFASKPQLRDVSG